MNSIYINLARRSQLLVEKQLQLLDEMERDEQDPERLAALFRLDHLAARLRRNDENLLILAGGQSRRRWIDPVPVSALALAALAEIDQYKRVRAEVDENLHINGYAAADLVHLVAELLDNATAFSAPDSVVMITAAPFGEGAVLEVIDEGIGMSPQTLQQANRLLARPPDLNVAASERMGLVVVSHLAARHQVKVRLRVTPQGVRASVLIPAALLAGDRVAATGKGEA